MRHGTTSSRSIGSENQEFVERFRRSREQLTAADRVTSDVIEAAYNSVWLWAQAVSEAGSEQVPDVIRAMRRQSLNAPEGIVTVDEETQHTWRPVYVGRIRSDGQFDLVWSSEKPIRPIPYPRSRSHAEWDSFLENLYRSWGGWANPGTGHEAPGGRGDRSSSRFPLTGDAFLDQRAAGSDRPMKAMQFDFHIVQV